MKKALAGFFAVMVLLLACKKVDQLGLQVQPNEDLLNSYFTDTVGIKASTIFGDSVRTDNGAATRSLLGDFKDPVFGRTQSSIAAQLIPKSTGNVSLKNGQIDSAVLILYYSDFYGDTNSTFKLNVYKLDAAISDTAKYYSNRQFTHSDLLATQTIRPRAKDSVRINSIRVGRSDTLIKVPAQVRMQLDTALARDLFMTNANYSSVEAFQSYFKGLHITVDSNATTGNGGILSFDMFNGARSKLSIYYKLASDTLNFDLEINSTAAVASSFTHNYSGSTVRNAVLSPAAGEQTVYVQSMAGVRAKLEFPSIASLTDSLGKIAIHKAELVLPLQEASAATLAQLSRLSIVMKDSTGKLLNVPDMDLGESFVGGYYDASSSSYRFNLSLFAQQVIDRRVKNQALYILSTNSSVIANRSIINGPQNILSRMRLNISYTKL